MKIAHVMKAKQLRTGDSLLVQDADGHPIWRRVVCIDPYQGGYIGIQFEAVTQLDELEARTRVLVIR